MWFTTFIFNFIQIELINCCSIKICFERQWRRWYDHRHFVWRMYSKGTGWETGRWFGYYFGPLIFRLQMSFWVCYVCWWEFIKGFVVWMRWLIKVFQSQFTWLRVAQVLSVMIFLKVSGILIWAKTPYFGKNCIA